MIEHSARATEVNDDAVAGRRAQQAVPDGPQVRATRSLEVDEFVDEVEESFRAADRGEPEPQEAGRGAEAGGLARCCLASSPPQPRSSRRPAASPLPPAPPSRRPSWSPRATRPVRPWSGWSRCRPSRPSGWSTRPPTRPTGSARGQPHRARGHHRRPDAGRADRVRGAESTPSGSRPTPRTGPTTLDSRDRAAPHPRCSATWTRQRDDAARSPSVELRGFEASFRANLTEHLRRHVDAVEAGTAEPSEVPALADPTCRGPGREAVRRRWRHSRRAAETAGAGTRRRQLPTTAADSPTSGSEPVFPDDDPADDDGRPGDQRDRLAWTPSWATSADRSQDDEPPGRSRPGGSSVRVLSRRPIVAPSKNAIQVRIHWGR